MGITGLLPIVKIIMRLNHIGKYSGSKIGIDGHAWIHQILPSISYELYTGKPIKKHLDIFMSKVKTLIDYNITPVFVFDGDYLESKEKTVKKREALRSKARAEVEFYLKRNEISKARDLMKRCVSVTPDVLHSILNILKMNQFEFIISPYEADAQLYFLQNIGYIDHILTEDSDLIVYGSSSVLYKFSGSHVEEYNSDLLHKAKDTYFKDKILDICILSGCDYADSIKGVGLITAHKVLKEKQDIVSFVKHMAALNKEVPNDYLEKFEKAKKTFLHHIVYNPLSSKRQFLRDPSGDCEFLGTLENIPIQLKIQSGSPIHVHRHHVPQRKQSSNSETTILKNSIQVNDDCIVDTDTKLPYFD
jgi:exonuclease 1